MSESELHPVLREIRAKLPSEETPFGLYVSFSLDPGKVDDFAPFAIRSVVGTRQEVGNQIYTFHQVADHPYEVRLIERWRSFRDLCLHFETEYLQVELEAIERCRSSPVQIEVLLDAFSPT
jgi:quinol monooxygenase YgiN